jgi:hypothetical protein
LNLLLSQHVRHSPNKIESKHGLLVVLDSLLIHHTGCVHVFNQIESLVFILVTLIFLCFNLQFSLQAGIVRATLEALKEILAALFDVE